MIRSAALFGVLVLFAARPAFADEAGVCADAAENGQRVRDKGHFTEARELFTKCARSQCPKLVRDDCLGFLDQLRKRMPSLVVRVTDGAHHDVTRFRVLRDGKVLLDKPSGTAIDTEPGTATLRVEAEGYKPRELPVVVAEGEQRRLVEIVLQPIGTPDEPPPEKVKLIVPPPEVSNALGPATWIAGGVGVAGLGVFGVFQALAQSQYGDVKKQCTPAPVHCAELDAVRTKFTASAIGLGVGAAGLGTALILYLAVDRHHLKPANQSLTMFGPAGFRF